MIHPDQMKPSGIASGTASGPACLLAALLAALLASGCASTIRGTQLAAEYYNLGNGYYELGEHAKAINYFRKALQLDPDNARARFNLALALVEANQVAEARLLLEELRTADPDNLGLAEALAFVHQVEGNAGEAESLYRHVLERFPDSTTARYNLTVLLEQAGRREEALRELGILLDAGGDEPEARIRAGSLQLSLGKYDEAAGSFLAYLQQRPDSVAAYLKLAEAYRLEERYDKALEAYEEALTYDEKQAEAWFYSALIQLTSIEDPDRGLTALAAALENGFRDAELLQSLLDSPGLLEGERVRKILAAHGLLPAPTAGAPVQAPGPGSPDAGQPGGKP